MALIPDHELGIWSRICRVSMVVACPFQDLAVNEGDTLEELVFRHGGFDFVPELLADTQLCSELRGCWPFKPAPSRWPDAVQPQGDSSTGEDLLNLCHARGSDLESGGQEQHR